MGFTLYFHFSPNDYFENQVLTKTYELKCEPQEDDPFSFEVIIQIQCQCISLPLGKIFSNVCVAGTRNHQMHWLYSGVEERKEPHSETSQEETETQVQRQHKNHHQASEGRQLLQFLRPTRCS